MYCKHEYSHEYSWHVIAAVICRWSVTVYLHVLACLHKYVQMCMVRQGKQKVYYTSHRLSAQCVIDLLYTFNIEINPLSVKNTFFRMCGIHVPRFKYESNDMTSKKAFFNSQNILYLVYQRLFKSFQWTFKQGWWNDFFFIVHKYDFSSFLYYCLFHIL